MKSYYTHTSLLTGLIVTGMVVERSRFRNNERTVIDTLVIHFMEASLKGTGINL